MIKVRKGLHGGRYRPLGDQDIEKIHKTSLRVFSEVGVQVNFAEAKELFRNAGAEVDDADGIVTYRIRGLRIAGGQYFKTLSIWPALWTPWITSIFICSTCIPVISKWRMWM
jgi:hypothetical protein